MAPPPSSSAQPAAQSSSAAVPNTQRQVLVSHILVSPAKAHVLDACEEQLRAGVATFDALAMEHSECKSASRGGLLGWLEPGTYFPSFEEVAMATPVGQRARATSPRGHHLILVAEERRVAGVQQMTVQELGELLRNPGLREEAQLVDVRELWEVQTAKLPGFKVYPLSGFGEWSGRIKEELDASAQTVVLCHHGVRSMQMSSWLVQQGFTDVHNVTGGIDAYSQGVDSSIPLY